MPNTISPYIFASFFVWWFVSYKFLSHDGKNMPLEILKCTVPILVVYYFTKSSHTTLVFSACWFALILFMMYMSKKFSWRTGYTGTPLDTTIFFTAIVMSPFTPKID